MQPPYLAAAIQMESTLDVSANIAAAERLIRQAAAAGATLIALPEVMTAFGALGQMIEHAETVPGPTTEAFAALARELNVLIVAGLIERNPQSDRPWNTAVVIPPSGMIAGRYRKIHLFEIDLPGKVRGSEERFFSRGSDVTIVATELGVLGLAICYDLRFPELFRALVDMEAQIIVVPSAFTRATGVDHWETLLRARAIENLAYVVAPNQCGAPVGTAATYGHSAIIDPWGRTLAVAAPDASETIVLAEIDLSRQAEIRRQLPALANRRLR